MYGKYSQQRKETAKLKRQAEAEAREVRIDVFRKSFGRLSKYIVYGFPDWKTRLLYRDTCKQMEVSYIAPSGKQILTTLPDLENHFQTMIEHGTGDHLKQMIEQSKVGLGPEREAAFCEEARIAKANKGKYHICMRCPQT